MNRALYMVKNLGLVTLILGLGVVGCAQNPGESDPEVVSIPKSAATYARAAAEIGKIEITQIPEFQASVERMTLDERAALWLTLKQVHDGIHPSEAAEDHVTSRSGPIVQFEDSESACSTDRCSHSQATGGTGWMCCAFGENAKFYHDPIIQK